MRWLLVALLLVGCSSAERGPEMLADYPEEERAEVLADSMVDGVFWRWYWEAEDVTFDLYYRSSDGSMCVVSSEGEVLECDRAEVWSTGPYCHFSSELDDSLGMSADNHDATTTYINLPNWPCPHVPNEADASTATDDVRE